MALGVFTFLPGRKLRSLVFVVNSPAALGPAAFSSFVPSDLA